MARRSLEPGLDVLQRMNAPLFAYLPLMKREVVSLMFVDVLLAHQYKRQQPIYEQGYKGQDMYFVSSILVIKVLSS